VTATGVTATRTPLAGWRDWRAWPGNIAALWRRSLRFRTIMVTLGLTALAVIIACVWMALAIQNDLFVSRKDQVLLNAQRATGAAQLTLDSATAQDDVQLQNAMGLVQSTLNQQSAADAYAAFRIGPPSPDAPQDFTSDLGFESLLTPGLRESVRANDDRQVWAVGGASHRRRIEHPGDRRRSAAERFPVSARTSCIWPTTWPMHPRPSGSCRARCGSSGSGSFSSSAASRGSSCAR
jgi:hypothetical protein